MEKLSQRDKRVLVVGAVAAGLILIAYYAVIPALAHWKDLKDQLDNQQAVLENIGLSDSPQARLEQKRLAQTVPAFEMPQKEDQQRQLFAEAFYRQVRQSGIRLTNPPQFEARVKPHPDKTLGLSILRLRCSGTCRFGQAMELLAALYENPYLYTVEEMHLACGERNREEMNLTLIVTTLCKM